MSLLFDPSTRVSGERSSSVPLGSPGLPSQQQLALSVHEFKSSLQVSDQRAREIERNTREQRHSSEWYSVRRYRLTASHFGEIFHRKADTPPNALVVRLLEPRPFTSPAMEWGVNHETEAIQAYIQHQQHSGHHGLTVCGVSFHVSQRHPFIGASPDGGVYDPSSDQPYGFLEVKCPYSHRDHTPTEACTDRSFFPVLWKQSKMRM